MSFFKLGLANALYNEWDREQNDKNAEERARDAFERQVYLRNTAHQAEVADLRAAGLNPILGVSKGGAAAPAVAMGSSHGSGAQPFTQAYSAHHQAELQKSQDLLTRQQIELAGEQATAARYDGLLKQAQAAEAYSRIPNLSADTALKLANVPFVKQQTETSATSARESESRMSVQAAELQQMEERLKALRTEGKIDDSFFGEVMRIINRGVQSLRGNVPVPGR